MEKQFTHEQYIQAVRDIAVQRLTAEERAAVLDTTQIAYAPLH